MNPDVISTIFFALLFGITAFACIWASRPKHPAAPADLVAKPARVIELPPVNSSHDPTSTYSEAADTPDGEPATMTIPEAIEAGAIRQQQEASSHLGYEAPETPCPAIQEDAKRLADLPVKRYTMNDFKTHKIAVTFADADEQKQFLQECEKTGFHWGNKRKPTIPPDDGCFSASSAIGCGYLTGKPKSMQLGYCEPSFYVGECWAIVPFSSFDFPTMDKPSVVAVTQPKQPRQYDIERSEIAEAAAHSAASELRFGLKREIVAKNLGYSNPESMRKALNRYGFRLNGQPKEAKQDA